MQVLEPERQRCHGLRNGVTTSLQQREINQKLMRFGGRWSLASTKYKRMMFTLEDMLQTSSMMQYKQRETVIHKDIYDWELQMLKDIKKLKMQLMKQKDKRNSQ